MAIQDRLAKFPVTDSEWRNYVLDQQINDRGICLDLALVQQAIACDEQFKQTHMEMAKAVTGLDNPNSPAQLKSMACRTGRGGGIPLESICVGPAGIRQRRGGACPVTETRAGQVEREEIHGYADRSRC